MCNDRRSSKPEHVLVVPFPGQGHINPALAFSKHLASKGLTITIITTTKYTKSAQLFSHGSITVQTISDGSEHVTEKESIEGYFKRFKNHFSKNLANFIDDHDTYKVVVYDSTMPWILDIAHERGLLGGSFFTQSSGVNAVAYYLRQGLIRFPYEDDCAVSFPCMPETVLGVEDLPSFDQFMDPQHTVMTHIADQFKNLVDVDWIFFNTFYELEHEILNWMVSQWPIKTIGPTLLLEHQDNKLSSNNDNHIAMLSPYEPDYQACKEWLDSKETGSVVYVSFGSIASLGKDQMEELAFGLLMTECHFLWVVRPSEVDKLPPNFASLASDKGLVAEWCHQPQVLAHRAVACFMTHCGWNSTLEALSHGVPLVAMAQWVDQTTNAKFIEDVWGVGVRVKKGENGIVGREEVAMCIKEVAQGDKGMELKRNACKWKDLASEAVQKGGTSYSNIEDFVTKVKCTS